jgi:hypothetical protein
MPAAKQIDELRPKGNRVRSSAEMTYRRYRNLDGAGFWGRDSDKVVAVNRFDAGVFDRNFCRGEPRGGKVLPERMLRRKVSLIGALKVDLLLENVYRLLMRYHYCAGEKGQALKVYRNCEKLFGELFGEGPTPQTRHLFEAISNNADLDC